VILLNDAQVRILRQYAQRQPHSGAFRLTSEVLLDLRYGSLVSFIEPDAFASLVDFHGASIPTWNTFVNHAQLVRR
jgi:hypothetical protein